MGFASRILLRGLASTMRSARIAARVALGLLTAMSLSALHAQQPTVPSSTGSQSLKLKLQQSQKIAPGLVTVQFVGYVDQRCPSNVQCVVPGWADALLWVSEVSGQSRQVTVPWHGFGIEDAKQVIAYGLQFCMVSLLPEATTTSAPEPGRVTVELRIRHAQSPAQPCPEWPVLPPRKAKSKP